MSAALILDPLGASPLRCVAFLGQTQKRLLVRLGTLTPSGTASSTGQAESRYSRDKRAPSERASEREGVEAMMRSQLHAAVSPPPPPPPPSLRRALPSVTPRTLR